MARHALWIALLPLAAHAFAPQTGGRIPGLGGRPALWCARATCSHLSTASGAAALQAQLKLPSQIDWEERGGGGGAGGAGGARRGSRENGEGIRLRGAERRYRRIQR